MSNSTLTRCVLAICLWTGSVQTALAEEQPKSKPTWEDKHTFAKRQGLFGKDPHIWVYTPEFAKRFGMPEEWIDPNLKGVEAAAWKKVPLAYEVCGWGRKEEACGRDETCDMEVYVDRTKNPLPWASWAIKRGSDIDRKFRSVDFLAPQGNEDYRPYSTYTTGTMQNPFADPETGDEAAYFEHRGSWSAPKGVNGYDMEAFPGLSLVVIRNYRCGVDALLQAVHFKLETRKETTGRAKSAGLPLKQFHEFVLPESFDRRIRERLKVDAEAKRDFYRRALEPK